MRKLQILDWYAVLADWIARDLCRVET
jgi:hypothetical protein